MHTLIVKMVPSRGCRKSAKIINCQFKTMWNMLLLLGVLDPLIKVGKVTGISTEEISGPRFLEEWPSSYSFSSRLGGSLLCGVYGQPHPKVEWVTAKDFFPLTNVTGLREVGESGNLRLSPFHQDHFRPDVHTTPIRCRASNPSGIIISPELSVHAVLDSAFEIGNRDVSVLLGNSAILRCQVPEFVSVTSWVQDGSVNIYPNFQTGKWLMLPTGELFVFNVEKADGHKTFACRTLHKLTNEAKTSINSRIIIKEPEGPESVRILVEREQRVRVRSGEETYLFCLLQGNPPPTYTWYRERDGVVTEMYSKGRQSSSGAGGPLHLSQVRLEDSGSYLCRGNNSHSADQSSILLTVYVPLRVQVSPSSQVVDVGRSATLRCLVSGSPVHAVEWYKDGVKVDLHRYTIGPKETLKVPSVHPEDSGMYQCLVTNDLYSAQDSAQIRLGSILPELVYRFSEQTIQPGPSVSLKCTAVGNPPPSFSWTLDGFPLPESERFLVGQYVTIHDNVISHVNITTARDEDGGLYSCQAKNAMGSVSHSMRLNIYGPPFVRQVGPIKAVAGRSLQIQCPVSGFPIEGITWEKGGTALPTTRMQRVYPNGSLIIEHIQKGDEGILTCFAKGRQGHQSSRDIHLRVVVPPKIMPFQFMNAVLREGMRAAVSCQLLEGDRPIDLVWEFEGKTITAATSSGITIRIPDEYSSTLVIDSLSSVHNGKYTCIAENSAGREHFSSELTVQIPPKWTVEPRDINVSAGHSLSLHCRGEGNPTPSISWKRATGPGEYKDITGGSLSPNGSIRLEQVRKGDEGGYLCEAKNGVGSGLSKVVFIKVNAPPQFTERETQLSVRAGEKGILQCRARGDLPLEIQWNNKHNKIGPHSNHRYTVREQELEDGVMSELVIADTDRSDGGGYSCRASNPFGQDHTSITLNVQEPPEQPVNIRLVEVGSRTVQLSWLENFNGNSPLINFIIQSKFPSETWTEAEVEELAVPATQSTAIVEGLSPSTTYHLRVLAQNGVGFSPPSDIVQIATTEENPEGPPLDIAVEALSSTKLRIRWAPPERSLWHGAVLGYYLGYRELSLALGDDIGGGESSTSAGTQHSAHFSSLGDMHGYHFKTVEVGIHFGGESSIDNLRKFTRYAILVQAFNSKGPGPSSSPLIATTLQDVPSLPPEKIECSATSPQSLHLRWDPPPVEARHGVIQGYKVQVLHSDDEESETKVVSESELILHGLRKYSNYSFSVRGFTAVGEGKDSSRLVCRTDEDVPSPPLELKTLVSSRRSILVSWLPPSLPNGRIVKYTVYMRLIDGTKVDKKVVSAGETHLEWSGLKESQGYEFWVSCTTRVGEGMPTTRTRATTNNKVGARIGSFGGEVEISWKKDMTLHCLAVGIPEPNVQWIFNGKEVSSGGRKEVLSGSSGALIVRDVTPDESGNYTCSATNTHGSDSIHTIVKVQVPPSPPTLKVTETLHTSLRLSWSTPPNGGSGIRGYLINMRKEGGDWEEFEVGPRTNSRLLQPLLCGSTYQVFLTAFNKIGSGLPSDIMTRTTKGHAPVSPNREMSILHTNHSTITIRLDQWNDNGCPITRFMIEYKPQQDKNWLRIPAQLNGEAKSYTLTGLHSNTKYEMRVSAGNNAGETVAKYDFLTGPAPIATNNAHGSVGAGEEEGEGSPLSTSLLIVFPSVLAIITVTAVIAFFCYLRTKRIGVNGPKTVIGDGPGHFTDSNSSNHYNQGQHRGPPFQPPLPQQPQHYTMVKGQHPDLTAGYKGRGDSAEYMDDVCPYATFQLPENPPGRPLLTKGFHTGDTLYNVGNVYSGPYQTVQSPPSNLFYNQATLPLREAEYLKMGRKVGVPEYCVGGEEVDAEVKKIMSMQNMPLSDYETLDSPTNHSPNYHNHTHHHQQQQHLHRQLVHNAALQQQQGMGTFRRGNNRSDPNPITPEHSSSSTEESSPTGRKLSYASSRKSKSKSSVQSGSSSMKANNRVRSSSGYSSHTEETSFTFAPPPSRFSDMADLGLGEEEGGQQDEIKYGTKRSKRYYQHKKGHIDV